MTQLNLPGQIVVKPDVADLVDTVADHLYVIGKEAIKARGVFHIALSGGSTPKVLFKTLVTDPSYRNFPWELTHVWVVDERVVPADDDRLNWNMMTDLLVNHINLTEGAAHPMPVDDPAGAEQYEADIRRLIEHCDDAGVPRFDYVLLGMGGDTHTASLFPHTPGIDETDRLVVFNDGEHVIEPRPRMTMTYPLINAARTINVLLTGASKQEPLQTISGAGVDPHAYPITGIRPAHDDGEMTWYLDAAAAGEA